MNKGKRLFVVMFLCLASFLSVMSISLYDNAEDRKPPNIGGIEYEYSGTFQLMTLDLASQLDASYHPIEWDKNLNKFEKQNLSNEFNQSVQEAKRTIYSDKNFYYVARNVETNQILSNMDISYEDIVKDDYSVYIDVVYDSSGNCVVKDNRYSSQIFSDMYLNDYVSESIENLGVIHTPKNMEFLYLIPKHPVSYVGISGYVNQWQMYSPFLVVLIGILACIMAFFMVIFPIRYVENVSVFKQIKEWYIEWNIILWPIILWLLFLGMIGIAGNTINGFWRFILDGYGIANIDVLLMLFNFVFYIFFLFAVAVAVFLLKHMIVVGPICYIKSHSIILRMIKKGKKKLDVLSEIDLRDTMNKTLLKYICLHACIIMLIAWLGSMDGMVALGLVMLYSASVYVYLKKNVLKIQEDYSNLLLYIKGIISENFKTVHEIDLGIFNSSKDELDQLSKNFEDAIQEKVKSQKLKTELISNVSHDLKTPLTCIKNYVSLLKEEGISEENRKYYIDQLALYTNRLKTLIEDLFDISKVDSGNIQLNLQSLNIISLLDQVYLENDELLTPKNLKVIKKYNVENPMLVLDSDKTYRIFENLFTNIGKYALENSRVYIIVEEMNNFIEIEFSNISEEPMDFNTEEIMERFVRGDRSRSKQGSGLGLAIARSFTEAQHGTFCIDVDCDLFKVKIKFLKEQGE